MKRVVTGVNGQGMSYVVSSEEIGEGIVWEFRPELIRDWITAIDPDEAANQIEPSVVGGSTWAQVTIAPGVAGAETLGVDSQGFHTTRTIDFVYILDGDLTLFLDEGKADLQKGDCVIQQATRHAWRNSSGKSTTILVLIHKPSI
jgi:mannose-6-phosphate isomerase-like protein (cupin superfamily)